jgi:hypothetical protein
MKKAFKTIKASVVCKSGDVDEKFIKERQGSKRTNSISKTRKHTTPLQEKGP